MAGAVGKFSGSLGAQDLDYQKYIRATEISKSFAQMATQVSTWRAVGHQLRQKKT